MNTLKICSGCQKPLEANAPDGLCPECLLKAGLGTGVDLGPDSQPESGRRNENKTRLVTVQRLLLFLLILVVCLVVVVLLARKGSLGTHPQFGGIYEAIAFDLSEASSVRLGVFVRDHLPKWVVRSPYFPSRYKDSQPRVLDLRDTQLEWSTGGTNTGYLYFIGPHIVRDTSNWEFAPCVETNLINVTKAIIPVDFYGSSDPRRAEVFGGRSMTYSIKVSPGHILFARRTEETNCIYILKLEKQHEKKLVVHYCVTTQQGD